MTALILIILVYTVVIGLLVAQCWNWRQRALHAEARLCQLVAMLSHDGLTHRDVQ